MVINYFESDKNNFDASYISPKSSLFVVSDDPVDNPEFENNLSVIYHYEHNYRMPGAFNDTSRFRSTSIICSKRVEVEEKVSSHYEYKRVGLFKKEPVLCMDSHKEKKVIEEPLVKGLEVLGSVHNGTGEIWYSHGYSRIIIDGNTGLPKLTRNPKNIEEVVELLLVDPRYIDIINPAWDFINDDTVRVITHTVGESFEKLIKCQDDYGVQRTEEEKNNRLDFESMLEGKAIKFVNEYKAQQNKTSFDDKVSGVSE